MAKPGVLKPNSQKPISPPNSSSSSSCSSLNYSIESCPKLAMKPYSVATLANPSGSLANPSAIGGTEEESVRNPTGRRSKRKRKPVEKVNESIIKLGDKYYSDPMRMSSSTFASENTDSISVEGAATILLMLYNEDQVVVDANIDNKFVEEEDEEDMEEGEIRVEKEVEYEEEEEQEEEEKEEPFDDSDYDAPDPIRIPKFSAPPPPKPSKTSHKGKFRCEACDRGFRSYQALGGHIASHKKLKPNGTSNKEVRPKYEEDLLLQASASGGLAIGRRVFKCSFCDKEFESGQALGGHKKVHFLYLGSNPIPNPKTTATPPTATSSAAATRVVENLVDLNLLAPEAEQEL